MIADLQEIVDVLGSAEPLERHFTVRTLKGDIGPKAYEGTELKAIRRKLKASQGALAAFLGVKPQTLSLWERGEREIPGPARRCLDDIQAYPQIWHDRMTSTNR